MKNLNKSLLATSFVALTLTLSPYAHAHVHEATPADNHAPIGVMGDHNHNAGEFMLSYRHARMEMKSIYNGSDQITRGDVLNSYMMAPVEMKMEAHMFGGMYGVTDNFTLMAMVPYIEKEMTMINQAGVMNTSSSRGVGDLKITSLITLNEKMDHESKDKWLLNVGASLPTGSIEERSDTGQKLAYPMQLGSGTIDPIVRLTYTHHEQDWSWGAQGNGVFRLGTNDQGYRLGHEYGATAWVAKNVHEKVSLSGRLEGRSWGDIYGRDTELNPAMSPAARTDLKGGKRVDAFIGVNFYQTGDFAKDHRLAAEFGMPLYQDLDGPQLSADYRLVLGWQYSW